MRNLLIIAVTLLGIAGCSQPTGESASADFARRHPGATVVSALAGEGDAQNVYFSIRYRMPPDDQIRTSELLYQRDRGSGAWAPSGGAEKLR